jgi:hypothetical protein
MRSKLGISLFVIAFFLLLAGAWLLTPGYFTRIRMRLPTTVLWHDDEAYILVAVEKKIAHATRFGLFLEDETADMRDLEYVTSKRLFTDMVLLRLTHDGFEKHYLKDFENARFRGGIFPYKGTVCYERGTQPPEEHPFACQWNGTQFEKLLHDDAVQAEAAFDPAAWKTNGWTWVRPVGALTEDDFGDARAWSYQDGWFGFREFSCSMTLGGKKLILIFRRDAFPSHRRHLLIRGLNGDNETSMIDLDPSWKAIKAFDYGELYQTSVDK